MTGRAVRLGNINGLDVAVLGINDVRVTGDAFHLAVYAFGEIFRVDRGKRTLAVVVTGHLDLVLAAFVAGQAGGVIELRHHLCRHHASC